MNYFSSGNKLAEHEEFCRDINKCKMTVPKYDDVAFRNFTYKQTTPFIIYADFECQLHNFTDSNVKLSKTAKYQKHVPYSAGYYFKCAYDDSLSYFRSYRGENCMEWFAKEMAEISKFVDSKIKSIVPMVKKPSTSKATACHICEKRFLATDIIVVDHDHFTGEVRGFAHQACNLNFRKVFVVPVAFHNFSGYDSHFMIIDLCKHGNLSLLPINKEKYISFTLHSDEHKIRLRFIDTMRFMGASLDELASLLDTSEKKILKQEFNSLDDDAFNLLTCKGVFCYDYVDSLEKLEETSLPTISHFYNKLCDEHISEQNYRGENCMEWFAKEMAEISKFVNSKIKSIVPMIKKPSTSGATACHICEKRFLATDIIVVDHDHFTGEVRGFAHQACNLNFRKVFVVPVAFHNFSGYDSHFMIIDLCKHGHLSLLPINKEKYISFTLHSDEHKIRLRFIDTMRFMGASLDELASLLDTSIMQTWAPELTSY
uniref:Uncharacterized protein LOC114346417 n=1 Tax=Diabrotica virgifera virgifera TaxID=50390 RepID=A0A6P7HAT8_DIAVI